MMFPMFLYWTSGETKLLTLTFMFLLRRCLTNLVSFIMLVGNDLVSFNRIGRKVQNNRITDLDQLQLHQLAIF